MEADLINEWRIKGGREDIKRAVAVAEAPILSRILPGGRRAMYSRWGSRIVSEGCAASFNASAMSATHRRRRRW
eukprot:1020680-Pyramimonas_sp.AAC.1